MKLSIASVRDSAGTGRKRNRRFRSYPQFTKSAGTGRKRNKFRNTEQLTAKNLRRRFRSRLQFTKSAAPQRVMHYKDGVWLNYAPEVVERLRLAFAERHTTAATTINGLEYWFNFLTMRCSDFFGKQTRIAWIDDNCSFFFPEDIHEEEEEESDIVPLHMLFGQPERDIENQTVILDGSSSLLGEMGVVPPTSYMNTHQLKGNLKPFSLSALLELLKKLVPPTSYMNILQLKGKPKAISLAAIWKLIQCLPIQKLENLRSGDLEDLVSFISTLFPRAEVEKCKVRQGKGRSSISGSLLPVSGVLNSVEPFGVPTISHGSRDPSLGFNDNIRFDMSYEASSGGLASEIPNLHTNPTGSENGDKTSCSGCDAQARITMPSSNGLHDPSFEPSALRTSNLPTGNGGQIQTGGEDGGGDPPSTQSTGVSEKEDKAYWIAIICAILTIISLDRNSLLQNGRVLLYVAGVLNIAAFLLNLLLSEFGRHREPRFPPEITRVMKWIRKLVVCFAFIGAACLLFPNKYMWLAAGCFWLIATVILISRPLTSSL